MDEQAVLLYLREQLVFAYTNLIVVVFALLCMFFLLMRYRRTVLGILLLPSIYIIHALFFYAVRICLLRACTDTTVILFGKLSVDSMIVFWSSVLRNHSILTVMILTAVCVGFERMIRWKYN